MRKKIILSVLALLLILGGYGFSQTGSSNPFFNGTENSSASGKVPVKNNNFIEKITQLQKQVNTNISDVITDYRTDKNLNLLFYIAGFAFIYGFIHAMTPGHGKNIILAWMLTSERTYIKVLLTSITGMFFHVFNSIIMVYLIWYIIKGKISIQSPVFIKYFSVAACVILCAMALKSLFDLFHSPHKHDSEAEQVKRHCEINNPDFTDEKETDPDEHQKITSGKHHHGHSHNLEKISSTTSFKECLMIALGIGMVPCPVAAILTVFMISGKLFAESILTAVFFYAGMTLTLLIHTTVVWLLRSFISGLKNRHLVKIRDYGLPAAGSILLMLSGFLIISPYINL